MDMEWKFYAERLLQKRTAAGDLHSLIFVHAPSSDGQPDHAYHLSQQLSRLTGFEMLSCFERSSKGKFQHKNRQDRLQHLQDRLAPLENITNISGSKSQIVFVDDIVTTGATFKSAYFHLGKPAHYEVWCLARRMKR